MVSKSKLAAVFSVLPEMVKLALSPEPVPDTRVNVQLVTRDATAPEDSVISVHTNDVEGAFEEAQKLGYEIVHPITTEPWGVRRFFVRAPDGNVINIVHHRD